VWQGQSFGGTQVYNAFGSKPKKAKQLAFLAAFTFAIP